MTVMVNMVWTDIGIHFKTTTTLSKKICSKADDVR